MDAPTPRMTRAFYVEALMKAFRPRVVCRDSLYDFILTLKSHMVSSVHFGSIPSAYTNENMTRAAECFCERIVPVSDSEVCRICIDTILHSERGTSVAYCALPLGVMMFAAYDGSEDVPWRTAGMAVMGECAIEAVRDQLSSAQLVEICNVGLSLLDETCGDVDWLPYFVMIYVSVYASEYGSGRWQRVLNWDRDGCWSILAHGESPSVGDLGVREAMVRQMFGDDMTHEIMERVSRRRRGEIWGHHTD